MPEPQAAPISADSSRMKTYQTVVIERAGGHYRLIQGEEVLLRIPVGIFERFEADAVFPPAWRPLEQIHPARRLFWNPASREFLMAGLEAHPARTAEAFGSTPYRSYLQGFWIPSPPVLLLRPYWSPPDPYDSFDEAAREESFRVQGLLLRIFGGLRPPDRWSAVLNATDPYLEALGVDPEAPPPDPEALREVSLTPPGPLESEPVRTALRRLAVGHVGSLFPVLQAGALVGVHALSLPGALTAEALFDELGLLHQQGPYLPH